MLSIGPDLRAGAVGWCTVTRFTARGRTTGAGTGGGAAAGAGSGFVAGGFGTFGGGVLRQAIVTRRVAVVVFPGNRRVVPRADRRLPFGWRAAILRDAEHPAARAAALPRTPGLSGRRLGRGWLVVAGGTAAERHRLLTALDPRP